VGYGNASEQGESVQRSRTSLPQLWMDQGLSQEGGSQAREGQLSNILVAVFFGLIGGGLAIGIYEGVMALGRRIF
jgi:hypothetical protein